MKAAHPEVVAATRVNPGETLRQVRESNGWTLAEVALKLNLTTTSLSNLEAGAFDKLPGHTFARGYIRAYAKLLGMDQTLLVQQFDQCTGTDSRGSNVHALGRIEEPVRVSHTILRIVSLLLLIAVIGGGFVWWQDQANLRSKDQATISMEHVEVESADGTTQIHPIDEPEDQAVAQNQPDSENLPETEATPAEPSSETQAEAPASTAPPAPATPSVVPVPHGAQSLVVPPQPAPSPVSPVSPNAPVDGAPAVAPVAGAGQIHVTFVADCWTQVTDGAGKVLFSGLKRKGDTLETSGKPPFMVRLGYAKGAQITYNGQAVDVTPFTSGETARLKLGQ
ncbi:helix-turn-helix domain-containing protein [Pseudomonas agarici]|uniref:RodZ domain-containing protein n=1 Tax=Pseudomonas agarici TaxID=46677 RepID=UPI0002E13760|nr:RodZ family helix-turn-helix domain-containing protein [Pseudomonas agarici]NWC09746.1 helix-turn-helix domain-containing protein [Pseudomonas agarici]SEL66295.1 cytoskeleton protein RodZ [Pseudomonas agarici]